MLLTRKKPRDGTHKAGMYTWQVYCEILLHQLYIIFEKIFIALGDKFLKKV